MLHAEGEILRSHAEGDIRVIDDFRLVGVGYHPGRDCLCRACHDHCITVTSSEYCGDCELAYFGGHTRPCH
jgi:hypothetical protein